MKATIERELKFEGDDIQIELLGGDPIEPHMFASSYHDTADRRLLRAGITLRRRIENGVSKWQLKLPSGETRLELEEPGGPASPPSALARLLSGILRGSRARVDRDARDPPPRPAGRRRRGHDRRCLGARRHGGGERFSEIEAELVNGSRRAIEHVGKALRELGATPSTETTKIMRVVELPNAPRVDPKEPALEHLRAFIRAQLDELRANDPIVRAAEDADAVHDMRVAVRRLRAVLRTARPMLDQAWSNDLRHELDLLGRLLGAVRDLDVLIERFTNDATGLGADVGETERLLAPLRSQRDEGRTRLRTVMDDQRYFFLLDRLEAATRSLPGTRADLTVDQLARKEFKNLRAFEKHTARDDDLQLHKLRIHSKRARYAAELARASRGAPAARFIKSVTRLQDVLGEHHDAVVALDELRRLASMVDSRPGAFTAGRLAGREERRKLEARHDLIEAWKDVKRRGKAAW